MNAQDTLPEMEAMVAEIVAEVLEQERPVREDNLFLLGVDSLTGQRVIHRLEQSLGLKLSTTLLFDCPTVASLASRLNQMLEVTIQALEPGH